MVAETYANEAGLATMNLRSGYYRIEVSATGYETASTVMIFDEWTNVNTSIKLQNVSNQEALICEVGGVISDAMNGDNLSDVALKFRKGYNVTSGNYILATTDYNGAYHVSDLEYGYYTVEIQKEGFFYRTNPFNGQYYRYCDIAYCATKEIRRKFGSIWDPGVRKTRYFHILIFADRSGNKRKVLYNKALFEYEINALVSRIEKEKQR